MRFCDLTVHRPGASAVLRVVHDLAHEVHTCAFARARDINLSKYANTEINIHLNNFQYIRLYRYISTDMCVSTQFGSMSFRNISGGPWLTQPHKRRSKEQETRQIQPNEAQPSRGEGGLGFCVNIGFGEHGCGTKTVL